MHRITARIWETLRFAIRSIPFMLEPGNMTLLPMPDDAASTWESFEKSNKLYNALGR